MRKVKEKLTDEQRLASEKEQCSNELKTNASYRLCTPEPAYTFKVGDTVRYGALKECVIDTVLENGKFYILLCTATNTNYGNPYDYKTYRFATWLQVRPITCGNTQFTEENIVHIKYSQRTIESLLHTAYFFGIDMNPEYQRDYVWNDKDRERLLDSIFKNIDIGKFSLIEREWKNTELIYEILDGKQRLNTLKLFFENRIPYRGVYYNDLSGKDKNTFLEHNISVGVADNLSQEDILKYFLILNTGGRSMDEEHLERVRQMLN